MSLEAMIREAEKSLGLGEPNHIQEWYRRRNGAAYNYNFPWCDAAVTYWAVQAGEYQAVCFGRDYAYTVAHAERFRQAGRWHTDVAGIRRGDIVFFDWGGTNDIARIDHVGVVTGVKDGKVYTIEGNTDNVCARRVRTAREIAGYGRPAYKPAAKTTSASTAGTYTVRAGDTLSEIGGRLGIPWQKIADLNGIKPPYRIYPGQVLKLPKAAGRPVVSLSRLIRAAKADPPKAGTPVSYSGVKIVEDALVREGLLAKQYADGHFGTQTVAAYSKWQQRLGYRGTKPGQAADGIPGRTSLVRLGDKYGFAVED